MNKITINGITIDTAAPKVALAALALHNADARASDYVLVQTSHPLKAAERQQLAAAGTQILEAVPGALVCHFPGTDLSGLRALPFVTWADVYPNVVKIAPTLLGLKPEGGTVEAAAAAHTKPAALDADLVSIDAVLHKNVDLKSAVRKIAAAAHQDADGLAVANGKVRLTVKRRRLADLANLDEIRHVELVTPRKLANSVARGIVGVSTPTVSGVQFTGSGEVVAVADTGFDKGSTTDVHDAFKGRVKRLYALGRPSKKDDPNGHGTHVAGSVLGDGVSTADGKVQGTAPGARLVFQSVLDANDGLGGLPDDLADLFTTPYAKDGARIHTNSWGSTGNFGVYDSQAREVDRFVYEHRDMLICFSAGNEGVDKDRSGAIDPGSITPPGTAKNCLTVGASENNRPNMTMTYVQGWPGAYKANPIRDDLVANDSEGLVAFSSRGPTQDGRIKPDVVAPGSYILSTRSRATESEGWLLSADSLYMYEGGTSMATPLVAGCAAVLREFLRVQFKNKKPSAALLKALLVNGAHFLRGQYVPTEAGAAPNNDQGFGRVDLRDLLASQPGALFIQDENKALDTGESETFHVPIPLGARQLKATLAWTDPPGEGLQSDLDLVVRVGDRERHGNMPSTSAGFDRVNNVEQVTWADVPQGTAQVTVAAHAVTIREQEFALAVRFK